ncbi:MAG: hypothetical protein ABEH77_02955, partial [Halobacteriaceae archaeon]
MTAAWLAVALAAVGLNTGYSALQKRLTLDYDGLALSYATSALGLLFMLPVGLWYVGTRELGLTRAVVGVILVSGVAN